MAEIAAALIVVGALAYSVYAVTAAHSDIDSLKHQLSTAQSQLNTDGSQLSTMGGNVATDESNISSLQTSRKNDEGVINNLNQEVSSLQALDRPQDPLANYDLICTSQNVNGVTGITQTFYYPCTNVAQTTPEPGA